MREGLMTSPVVRSGAGYAASFFAVTALWGVLVRDEGWSEVLVRAAVCGVALGAVMALWEVRRRRVDDPDDQSPRAVGRRVRRASSRGPVPEDPDERHAAHEMALDHLRELDRQRYWAPVLFVAMAALWAGVALTGPSWVWVLVPVLLAAAVGHPLLRGRMRDGAELLAPEAPLRD